jgi:hypothetical protein
MQSDVRSYVQQTTRPRPSHRLYRLLPLLWVKAEDGVHNPKAGCLGLCNVFWKGIKLFYSKIIRLDLHKENTMFLINRIDFYL